MRKSNFDLGLKLFRDQLKDQMDTIPIITNKVSIMMGIAIVMITTSLPSETSIKLEFVTESVLFLCMHLGFIACIFLGLYAIWPRNYRVPQGEEAKEILDSWDFEDAQDWIFDAYTMSCNLNAKVLDKITKANNRATMALLAGIIFQIAYWIATHPA